MSLLFRGEPEKKAETPHHKATYNIEVVDLRSETVIDNIEGCQYLRHSEEPKQKHSTAENIMMENWTLPYSINLHPDMENNNQKNILAYYFRKSYAHKLRDSILEDSEKVNFVQELSEPGIPDLLCWNDQGNYYFIEVKTERDQLNQNQKNWIDKHENLNTAVARIQDITIEEIGEEEMRDNIQRWEVHHLREEDK